MSHGKLTKVDAQSERHLFIGLITSKPFCERIIPILDPTLLSAAWATKVSKWCISHYLEFKEPIMENIQTVYNKRSSRMPEEEQLLIGQFLESIAEEFNEEEHSFNVDFWVKECTEFIRKVGIEKRVQETQDALSRGDVTAAEHAMASHKAVQESASHGYTLADVDLIIDRLFNPENNTELFDMEGSFGAFFGTVYRGDLVGILAESKAGKTFLSNHIAHQAASRGLRVLYISHEMSERECDIRNIEYMTKQTYLGKYHEDALYTRFDCKKCQAGRCRDKRFTGDGKPMIRAGEDAPRDDYIPCNACASDRKGKFEAALCCREIHKPKLTEEQAASKLKRESKWYGSKFHIDVFPPGSANHVDIELLLDKYAMLGIFFDVLVDDYINIHKGVGNEWNRISDEWLECKRIANERGIAYISPVHKKGSVHGTGETGASTIGGGKDMFKHVNKLVEFTCTEKEEQYNVLRVKHTGGRIGKARKSDTCFISQVREHGIVVLDSLWSQSGADFEEFQKEEKSKGNSAKGGKFCR